MLTLYTGSAEILVDMVAIYGSFLINDIGLGSTEYCNRITPSPTRLYHSLSEDPPRIVVENDLIFFIFLRRWLYGIPTDLLRDAGFTNRQINQIT